MATPQESEFAGRLPATLPQAIGWAAQQSALVIQSGTPLDSRGLKIARAVGVKHPELIRVWTVIELPAPSDPELRRFAAEQNLIAPGTRGFTLGYGILIRQGDMDVRLLSHESRHVYQVEEAGSLDAFLTAYLKQIADVGYGRAPCEVDARHHEIDTLPEVKSSRFATAVER